MSGQAVEVLVQSQDRDVREASLVKARLRERRANVNSSLNSRLCRRYVRLKRVNCLNVGNYVAC